MSPSLSNTVLTRILMELRGYWTWRVEHWDHHAKKKFDLWACDVIGTHRHRPHLLTQTTSRKMLSARKAKMLSVLPLWAWVTSGGLVELHGWDWKQEENPNTGRLVSVPRVKVISLKAEDFEYANPEVGTPDGGLSEVRAGGTQVTYAVKQLDENGNMLLVPQNFLRV